MTTAMTPAKWLAYGCANTVTVPGSSIEHTHERASCGDKMQVIAPINTGCGAGTDGDSTNSSEDNTKETLVVDLNKRVETSISERESISLVNHRS